MAYYVNKDADDTYTSQPSCVSYAFDMTDCIEQRMIVHMHNGNLICGVLKKVKSNGDIVLTEAIQSQQSGLLTRVGKVKLEDKTMKMVCRYYQCFACGSFPLNLPHPGPVAP